MKAYKKRFNEELGQSIRQFEALYGETETKNSKQYKLVVKIFDSFKRPLAFMETKIRPSVSMGIWQERWMMTQAVEAYLKECCQRADRKLDELKRTLA